MTMTLTVIALAPAVLLTAALSGIFGMGGGMILMAVYALALPVGAAMVLHGATQLAANGYRALLARRHIRWRVVPPYAAGALATLAVFWALAIRVDRAVLFLALGGTPLILALIPRLPAPPIDRPRGAFACGVVVTAGQLLAGAAGSVLDLFFLRARMNRFEIIATKAITQSLGHVLKIAYFGSLIGAADASLPWLAYPLAIAAAMIGTTIGVAILARLSEAHFRRWSAALVFGISVAFACKGLAELL